MEQEQALWSQTHDVKQAMQTIADKMLRLRPRDEVRFRPYRISPAARQHTRLGALQVDLKKLYPDACVGDTAYVGTILESVAHSEIALLVQGDVTVFFRGEQVYDARQDGMPERKILELVAEEGDNELLFLCRCSDEGFGVSFTPSVRHYPGMWAKDYLLHMRACSPIAAFRHEDGVGVSRLYHGEAAFDGTYVYPDVPEPSATIRFDEIFPEPEGACAYALTYCLEDTVLHCEPHAQGAVLVNGCAQSADGGIPLKKGDTVLVKAVRGENWSFAYRDNPGIGIPFLHSARPCGDRWLTLGTFGNDGDCLHVPMGPELDIHFDRPYRTDRWQEVYWKLTRADDTIRPYVDTCFYAQWFYALMVGQYGLLQAADVLGRPDYLRYFIDGIQTMAQFFTYANYDAAQYGDPTFMARATHLYDLDSIGSMGMNLAELYRLTASPEALHCISALADAMFRNIPRFADGTFYRGETMWADDVFMSCPFLVRLGRVTGKPFYFEECARQLAGFKKRLYREEKKLFSHIFFVEQQQPNEISWGRGNGWIFISLADLLTQLPEDTQGYDMLLYLFQEFAQGILAQQDETGLWHQVLDRPGSYLETSCTGMFVIGMCKGMRYGWLPRTRFEEPVRRAVQGLLSHAVDREGNIYGVCKGSGCSMDPAYYEALGAVKNDDHGTGIVLSALAEFVRSGLE